MTSKGLSAGTKFQEVAALPATAAESGARPKRLPPFSLRLTENQRAQLEAEADGMPLGAHIKRKVLGESSARGRVSVADKQAIAQILALLGQSRIANNLNQLARAANLGILAQTPEEQAELAFCLAAIAEMRGLLIKALGLKAKGSP